MRAISLSVAVFFSLLLSAQRYEAGVFLGGANAIADVGSQAYVSPKNIALGGFFKKNLNERYAIRLSGTFGVLQMKDRDSNEQYRINRNLTRTNYVSEGSLVFEFNFFNFNGVHRYAHTPYLFVGIGGFLYQIENLEVELTSDASKNFNILLRSKRKYDFSAGIPFGIGYRYKFNYNWVIGAELGFRTTFTDNLDKGLPSIVFKSDGTLSEKQLNEIEKNTRSMYEIGNKHTNDWYVFSGVSLSYTFGRKPCNCP